MITIEYFKEEPATYIMYTLFEMLSYTLIYCNNFNSNLTFNFTFFRAIVCLFIAPSHNQIALFVYFVVVSMRLSHYLLVLSDRKFAFLREIINLIVWQKKPSKRKIIS